MEAAAGEIRFIRRSAPGIVEARVDFCVPQLNLLAHAQAIELDIGSKCGGHGICGGDRLRIIHRDDREKFSGITELERQHLSSLELEEGYRLACQCYPEMSGLLVDVEFI